MYSSSQERDEFGRFASNSGPSQSKAERIALNQKLDARNRSLTYGFGPAARAVENKGAHTAGIDKATQGRTLAQLSAAGTNQAFPPPTIKGS
jgi:hypothetical protein